jgi:hypothetical protein
MKDGEAALNTCPRTVPAFAAGERVVDTAFLLMMSQTPSIHSRETMAITKKDTRKKKDKVPPAASFPSSASALRPGGWRPSRPSSPACRPTRSRHGLCPGAAPGPGPQEHPHRSDPALHPHAGLRGRGRHGGAAQLRLHHPAQPRHGLFNGTLQLLEPASPRGQRLPIDFFFRSLAQDQHERAIGIVLSGTGSDGTLGMRAIKGEGGMVMAQNPESTEYDGMPRSAIATGLVDYELPPAEMPAQLIAYAAHAFGKPPGRQLAPPQAENALKKIFVLLRAQTGHDFSQYKPSTIQPAHRTAHGRAPDRNHGRLRQVHQQTPGGGGGALSRHADRRDQFLPRPRGLQGPGGAGHPQALCRQARRRRIRVWVAGLLHRRGGLFPGHPAGRAAGGAEKSFKVQVFATDIDSQAIATARAGIYPASIAADLSPERLARFFHGRADGSAYRIHKGIRDMLVFSEQNVIKDPPFSKLDLISCRNLLIYLGGDLQKKLIPCFTTP